MFDIKFFKNTNQLKKEIVSGQSSLTPEELYDQLESYRKCDPHLFNLETTNNCNMTCVMCPRTKLMTRPITYIGDEEFEQVLDQIKPHTQEDLNAFWDFIVTEHGVVSEEMSENAFYFYDVSRCVILHGYGEPIIDPNIVKRIQSCSDRQIPTYFSCVPANIKLDKFHTLMDAGLGVIKFSMDGLDDESQKAVRGKNNNFTKAFESILKILDYKADNNYLKTKIAVTMISFADTAKDRDMQRRFMELWENYPVYAYVKSQDNRWLHKKNEDFKNQSHYETQYCEFPWTSLSIMSNGAVVPCTQDYNASMVMGMIGEQSLKEIWNGEKYSQFRLAHLTGQFKDNFKCKDQCDLKKVYQLMESK